MHATDKARPAVAAAALSAVGVPGAAPSRPGHRPDDRLLGWPVGLAGQEPAQL